MPSVRNYFKVRKSGLHYRNLSVRFPAASCEHRASASGRIATRVGHYPVKDSADSHFGLFRHFQGIIDFDTQIADGALELAVPQ
jgi:hypothetical protein